MAGMAVVMNCLLSAAALGVSEPQSPTFSATLANGATVELLAVATNESMPEDVGKQKWWRPDGTVLPEGLFHYPGSATSSIKARQFVLRIKAEPEFSCMTMNSLGPTAVQPVPVFNRDKTPLVDLRVCAGKAAEGASSDTLRVGVGTGPWEVIEQWQDTAWGAHDSDNIMLGDSEHPLVLFWPRTKRGAIVVEMVSAYTDQAVRLKITDKNGHSYYEAPRTFGRGKGLVRHQYWLWDTKIEDLRTMTLETRPYHWVEFQNVSLEPNVPSDVRTVVLPVAPEAMAAVTSDPATCLGALLDGLSANVKLPARGHVNYEVRDGERVLRCDYWFDGSRYRVHKQGSWINSVTLFDGYRSVMWEPGRDFASINRLERMDSIVYKLDQYCPRSYIDQLQGYKIVPLPDEVIDGVPCKVLKNVISSKDTVKLWVATEPGVFPLRIERYEHEGLRYRYEAQDLRLWSDVIFPKSFSIARFREDDSGQPLLVSEKHITLDSLAPGVPITPQVLSMDLPEKVLARLPELKASTYSLVGKPLAVTQVPGLADHIDTGRPAIVCFVDINQRPSRHCLAQLKEVTPYLKERGFNVLAVQVSVVEQGPLNKWVQENDSPFAILAADSDFEQERSAWGIASLPWIVRTDDDHFVTEEGLSLEMLGNLQRP